MLLQKRGHCTARLIVLFHAQGQRLCAAHYEPGIERRENRAGAVLDETNPRRVILIIQNNDAADSVGVSVQILSSRVDHYIDAKLNRALQVG